MVSLAIETGRSIHEDYGPGLFEAVYESILCHRLQSFGLGVERQKIVPVIVDGLSIRQGFRADLIVEEALLIELKSLERLRPLHGKQGLTYLRLLDLPVGLLMNFGGETLDEGLRRVENRRASPCPAGQPLPLPLSPSDVRHSLS